MAPWRRWGRTHFKRLLAYSSISQVGYIVLGLGCGTPLGLAGAVFHFFNHAVFKSLLFVNAAAVKRQTGRVRFDEMGGLAQKMPLTGITSAIASLSTAGDPAAVGLLEQADHHHRPVEGRLHAYAFLAVLASLITLGYMLMLQRRIFFGQLADWF